MKLDYLISKEDGQRSRFIHRQIHCRDIPQLVEFIDTQYGISGRFPHEIIGEFIGMKIALFLIRIRHCPINERWYDKEEMIMETRRNSSRSSKANPSLKDIYTLLQTVVEDVSTLKKDVAELKQDVAMLKKDVAELKQDVAELKQDVLGLKKGQESLLTRMNHLEAELANFKESVHDRFDIMNRRFDSIDKRFESTDIHIGGLERAVLAQTEDVIDLKNRMGRVETHLENMDQKFTLEIRELRVEIRDRVIVRIDNHEGRIYNLERRPAS